MNHNVPNQLSKITQWHKDRNLIDGSTNNAQFVKLLEEVIELYATLNPNLSKDGVFFNIKSILSNAYENGRIKQAPKGKDIKDDVGDINVVLMNMIEREGFTMQQCLETAWHDIKDRKGEMRNGVFVKEGDL